jgi:hypothetical protein
MEEWGPRVAVLLPVTLAAFVCMPCDFNTYEGFQHSESLKFKLKSVGKKKNHKIEKEP